MKNIILILALTICSAAMSETAKPAAKKNKFERQYGLAGCGLGSVVMGKHGGQVSAATTNGTSFNQIFGISAGTLNCLDTATAEVANRMDQFIDVNHSQLQGDIAKGNGETISAISSYMGCSQSSNAIGQSLKSNYSTIFSKANATGDITDTIINVILSNPELSSKCVKILG
jgi:hypothetical protein